MSISLSRYATQESKKIPKIVHPLKTSSCGMFSRIYSRKHEARSAVIGLLLGSSKNVFEGTYGRQAFSVVGVINHGSPRRGKGSASHTKTLMETTSRRNQLSPLPKIGEGLGSGLKPLLMKRGLGVMEVCRACPAYKKTIKL